MLLVSFATVLFTLSIWKLLTFFIMPSLFFDLLFVGFPVGAFLGVRFFRVSLRSFQTTLAILQGAMLLSVALSLACKHSDYLRANLFEVRLLLLLQQMATFTAFFLPFFCAYGLSEYVGYQLGTQRFRGRMRWVYAVYLFGAALAYVFLSFGLATAGITGMIALAVLLVPVASLILSRAWWARALLAAEVACIGIACAFLATDLEAGFLRLYKGRSEGSTHDFQVDAGYEPAFQKWGRYSLTEILYSQQVDHFAGFYNDILQWEYSPRAGFWLRMLGMVPIHMAPKGGKIAIIGAGGGRQVKWASQPRYGFSKIVALEIEPAVFEAVRGPLLDAFGRVYEHPSVTPILAEARGYMESTRETFDLIFLPSVGGYPQMMLEPGNMIRTSDAYRVLKDRLTDRGLLAIWYPRGLDPKGVLTNQYVRTLGRQGLGLKTEAYFNEAEYLIVAARDPAARLPTTQDIDAFLRDPSDPSGLPPEEEPGSETHAYFVLDDPQFKPITDDQPFLAGNVRHIFSLEQLYTLLAIVGSFLAVVGTAILFCLRRSGDPHIPGRSYWQVAGLAFLIGANFILCEHFVVLALFRKLYLFQDALLVGAISFLVVSGLGSILITPRKRVAVQAVAVLLLLPLIVLPGKLSPGHVVLLMAPVAFVTGSFFPSLFDLASRNPLGVFAMDALGAAVGSALSFFIPIAFGFSVFFPIAAAVFVATAVLTWRFTRGQIDTAPAPMRYT